MALPRPSSGPGNVAQRHRQPPSTPRGAAALPGGPARRWWERKRNAGLLMAGSSIVAALITVLGPPVTAWVTRGDAPVPGDQDLPPLHRHRAGAAVSLQVSDGSAGGPARRAPTVGRAVAVAPDDTAELDITVQVPRSPARGARTLTLRWPGGVDDLRLEPTTLVNRERDGRWSFELGSAATTAVIRVTCRIAEQRREYLHVAAVLSGPGIPAGVGDQGVLLVEP